jgi:beta-mannosidase
MIGRLRGVTGHRRLSLSDWRACGTPPGALDGPAALAALGAGAGWLSMPGPSTAAAALRGAGRLAPDGAPPRLDAEDWWFQAHLPAWSADGALEHVLCLGGLATLADVWLDDRPILSSDGMFVAHEVRLPPQGEGHRLTIRCRALDPALAGKKGRPRWRTPMVSHQQLRWFRATLLGRTPGWSPPWPAVGPWRPVWIEERRHLVLEDLRLSARLDGGAGRIELSARLRAGGDGVPPLELVVARNGRVRRAPLVAAGDRWAGALQVDAPDLWWPHTHGEPALYDVRLEAAAGVAADLGAIGFRDLARLEPFALQINGARVFCRGACWTPLDPVTLSASGEQTVAALEQARAAGMNMLRVGGTMVYESDAFYDACDRLGILVWQDFMFANMDYPEDESFVAGVREEVRQVLGRLQARPSVAVLCGNSEGEQQAAMWGATRDRWSPRLFHEVLPELVRERCPDVPYWPSSAHGGAFPHEAATGTTSYYGVGAYLRPLEDARRAEVRFASECLAFANVPGPDALPGGPGARVHHPSWKARTPRDLGAGWDFDDVRDHYLAKLFAVDPLALRYADHDRYLALGRVVTGEVMAQVFGEWRRLRSTCAGGLVWFLRDLWTGAGWGVVDAGGAPKAAWHYLRRALQPASAHLSDEGGNGLVLHLCNDGPRPLTGEIDVTLFRGGETRVAGGTRPLALAPHAACELPVASFFDGFYDVSYAYRFGPPSHDLVVAAARVEPAGAAPIEAFHFPLGLPTQREHDLGLTATLEPEPGGARVTLKTRRFAQSVALDVPGYEPDDAHFHLAPGGQRTVRLRALPGAGPPRGSVQPLNAHAPTKIA